MITGDRHLRAVRIDRPVPRPGEVLVDVAGLGIGRQGGYAESVAVPAACCGGCRTTSATPTAR